AGAQPRDSMSSGGLGAGGGGGGSTYLPAIRSGTPSERRSKPSAVRPCPRRKARSEETRSPIQTPNATFERRRLAARGGERQSRRRRRSFNSKRKPARK